MSQPEVLFLRVSPEVKAAMETAARDEELPVSTQAIIVIKEWLRERGYLTDPRQMSRIG